MLTIQKATDVRKEFSRFIDTVVHKRPIVVQRNRDLIVALSLNHLSALLEPYRFTMEYEQEDDGSYSGSLLGFDIAANAKSQEELKVRLAQDLVEYAHEYEEEFVLYSLAPNRRSHFPYIYRVLIQPDIANVVGLIDA